ncbi:hypothetical protein BDE27_1534 [Xenorhabdus ehlersii]|uniref:Uncharacterized protein n=1 Tax=Xenorhabdus ehlersii TaxID=290111 RepID=A0A2D0IS77_9GAMM|nr:hypothetical protein [Xenorhabdus sp. TS4]PHM24680.1 hypothetical protein Xehl_01930 [Xenorhabdus ehlersii]RKE91318.1 hypothetical protein BDE27_1534 [Xenorhabdus ehlersii]
MGTTLNFVTMLNVDAFGAIHDVLFFHHTITIQLLYKHRVIYYEPSYK